MKKLKMKLENKENVVIVGAGGAGRELFHELQKNFPKLSVIGFIDDFVKEKISKIPILGNVSEINKILSTHKVDTIFIAMPSSEGNLIKKIILESAKFSVKIKVIPRFSEIILNKASLNQLREIDVEDVIGRSINREMFNEISPNVKKNSFMVFGAAGSIGSKLCQQIASLSPKKLIMVDSNENGMFYLQEKINNILLDDSDSEKKNFLFILVTFKTILEWIN